MGYLELRLEIRVRLIRRFERRALPDGQYVWGYDGIRRIRIGSHHLLYSSHDSAQSLTQVFFLSLPLHSLAVTQFLVNGTEIVCMFDSIDAVYALRERSRV